MRVPSCCDAVMCMQGFKGTDYIFLVTDFGGIGFSSLRILVAPSQTT